MSWLSESDKKHIWRWAKKGYSSAAIIGQLKLRVDEAVVKKFLIMAKMRQESAGHWRHLTKEERDIIADRTELKDATVEELAKDFMVGENTIRNVLRQAGVEPISEENGNGEGAREKEGPDTVATENHEEMGFTIYERDEKKWFYPEEIAEALGYSSTQALLALCRRHADELKNEVRDLFTHLDPPIAHTMFTLRGFMLVAMLSKTPKASEVRTYLSKLIVNEMRNRGGNGHREEELNEGQGEEEEIGVPEGDGPTDKVMLPEFNGVVFDIHDHKGERWVTVKQVAKALGYSNADKLNGLIRRNHEEFKGKVESLKLRDWAGGKPNNILNYDGVILAAMLSRTSKSVDFRRWAIKVLKQVMLKGYYMSPDDEEKLREALSRAKFAETEAFHARAIGEENQRILGEMRTDIQTTNNGLNRLADKLSGFVDVFTAREKATPPHVAPHKQRVGWNNLTTSPPDSPDWTEFLPAHPYIEFETAKTFFKRFGTITADNAYGGEPGDLYWKIYNVGVLGGRWNDWFAKAWEERYGEPPPYRWQETESGQKWKEYVWEFSRATEAFMKSVVAAFFIAKGYKNVRFNNGLPVQGVFAGMKKEPVNDEKK